MNLVFSQHFCNLSSFYFYLWPFFHGYGFYFLLFTLNFIWIILNSKTFICLLKFLNNNKIFILVTKTLEILHLVSRLKIK